MPGIKWSKEISEKFSKKEKEKKSSSCNPKFLVWFQKSRSCPFGATLWKVARQSRSFPRVVPLWFVICNQRVLCPFGLCFATKGAQTKGLLCRSALPSNFLWKDLLVVRRKLGTSDLLVVCSCFAQATSDLLVVRRKLGTSDLLFSFGSAFFLRICFFPSDKEELALE